MSNNDYLGYIISFAIGVAITYIGHWLARRRQKEETKKDVKVFCDLHTIREWVISGSESVYEMIAISAVNDG